MNLDGIITPIFTPFNRDEEQSINYDALKQHIDYLIERGVAGIFILGSNGEFHVVTDDEKVELSRKTVEFVNHRVPVYVGTGGNSTREVIRLTKRIEETGADAISVITPYFIKPSDEELVAHYTSIAKSTSLPIILYNIPKNTGINLSKYVISKLAKIDNIVGIKDSSGDMDNLKGYLEAAGNDMKVLIGSDSKIVPAIRLGACGAIAGTSNVITEHIVGIYQALKDGNYEKADAMQGDIEVLRTVNAKATVPSVMKRAVEIIGIPVGPARLPVKEVDNNVEKEIREMLEYYQLL